MALVLKSGQNFVDPRTKAIHAVAHGVVGRVNTNYVVKWCAVCIDIFANQAVTDEGNTNARLGEIEAQFQGEEYDTYFAKDILALAGNTEESQALLAMMAKIDPSTGELLIDPAIWESDEV